jgi:hypothetical protein
MTMIKKMIFSSFLAGACAFGGEYYYMNGDKRVDLTPVPRTQAALRALDNVMRFKNPAGEEIAIPDRIIVKFKSTENLDNYLKHYDLTMIKRLRQGVYLLGAKSPEAALEAANRLNELPDVRYAQPDIIRKVRLR